MSERIWYNIIPVLYYIKVAISIYFNSKLKAFINRYHHRYSSFNRFQNFIHLILCLNLGYLHFICCFIKIGFYCLIGLVLAAASLIPKRHHYFHVLLVTNC